MTEPTAMVSAFIDGGVRADLFVGFRVGGVLALTSTGGDELFEVDSALAAGGPVSDIAVDGFTQNLAIISSEVKVISLYDYSGDEPTAIEGAPDISEIFGRPVAVELVRNMENDYADLALLFTSAGNATLNLWQYADDDASYDTAGVIQSSNGLKNFAVLDQPLDTGFAAISGSLSQFYFSRGTSGFEPKDLPFDSKDFLATAGDGGLGSGSGKGGNGGAIYALNIEATRIIALAGAGGDSIDGPGGSGGSFSNPGSMTVTGLGNLAPKIVAEELLLATSGAGGTATGVGAKASGGNGGSFSGVDAILSTGTATIIVGDGGDGTGGNGGHGGDMKGGSFLNSNGGIILALGNGGNTATGKAAGNGGSFSNFKYTLDLLDDVVDPIGDQYSIDLIAGNGGTAAGTGNGGNGGGFTNVTLKVDPADDLFPSDNTSIVTLLAGNGGGGGQGGKGGSFSNSSLSAVADQDYIDPVSGGVFIVRNFLVADVQAGNGGVGTAKNGGDGGAITNFKFKGVTTFDPDGGAAPSEALLVTAGDGGDGAQAGGKGGSLSGIKAYNSPFYDGSVVITTQLASAALRAGDGGNGGTKDGGKGGDLSGSDLGVSEFFGLGGTLTAVAGNGGDSVTGKGGNGGKMLSTSLGSVSGSTTEVIDPLILTDILGGPITGYSVVAKAGSGGDGAKGGGVGGDLSNVFLDSPQNEAIFGGFAVAGDGGDATGAGAKGGAGGKISNLRQDKDLNSSLALVQAGDGGDSAAGTAGKGGDVNGVRNAGLIGRPVDSIGNLGAFVGDVAQGVFAGRAGIGVVAALNGAVASVTARQIAAIGASVDAAGLFGVASKVSGIKADLIGFEDTRDNIFESSGAPGTSPSAARPIDGFILASAISSVTTFNPARTTAFSFTA